MFNRSREFKPLISCSSHMRLRNLIKITAVNLQCDNNYNNLVYFTLHLSAFSKPFYTSKSIEMRNNKADWPEINCEQYRKSSQKFICIRVWQTMNKRLKLKTINDDADKMLFLWGVYFSGLVSTMSESIKFKENTLLFHLDGSSSVFTSNDQIIYQPHTANNNIIPTSVSSEEAEQQQKDCDKDRDKYSNTNSNQINGNGMNNKAKISPLPSSSPPKSIESYEHPLNVMDILNDYHKVRYVQLNFPKNEIQKSYTLEKLLQIQEIQREIRDRKELSKILGQRICVRDPACLDLNLIMSKPVFYEPQKQKMGKALSRLLTQSPPKPEILIKGHELRIKIESARFRIKLLSQERDRIRLNNNQLIAKREKLKDDNTDTETRIWNSLRTLNRENLRTYEEKLALQREVFMNIKLALLETKRSLLKELNEIYTVKKCDRIYTINGIHLPDAESYGDTQSTPVQFSIALGYVAHAVLIISRILNVPLRNPIRHEGSHSKILDNIKVLEPVDRIFPLFCRMTPPQNVLLYGVYLLNQNISQLKFMLNMSRGDLRATLANLWDLMNGISAEMYSRFVEDVKPVENSASSMDSVPINMNFSLSPLTRRKSRSLEDFEDVIDDFNENISSSVPDLTSPQNDAHLEEI